MITMMTTIMTDAVHVVEWDQRVEVTVMVLETHHAVPVVEVTAVLVETVAVVMEVAAVVVAAVVEVAVAINV
jgi:hypothetical protein